MTGKSLFYEKKNILKQILYLLLSFLIPAILILVALIGLKVTPFGDNSLVISDGNGLYINYMGYISKVLKGQEGILYSFTKGTGGNMMGSWGWFLLNPLFSLFALTDLVNYMQMYTLVSLLSFSLCGLTMYIMLKDFYRDDASNLIFSTAYALNGFLVANVFQLNFFVVIPVLPIMFMGLVRILKDKNPTIYICAISYCLLTNFYFGFMVCVASLIIFTVVIISEYKRIENLKSVVVKYIFSSLSGGGVSCFVWLPALLSLRGGRLDQSIARAISFKENMPFIDMFSKLFIGANSTSELSNGLPNIYVGILPVFLVIIYFSSKTISKNKKRAAAILLIFYLISFYVSLFNIAMHGGTVTNWFNYRDSFIFCFLVLLIAADEWQHFADEPEDLIKRGIVVLIIATIIVFNKKYEFVSGSMALVSFVILLLMLLALFMHKKNPEKNPKSLFNMVVLVLMCLDLYMNYYFSVKNIMDWTNKETEYQQVTIPVGALVDAVRASDNSFYRMEVCEQRSGNLGNDPMLYGYYGVGHGGSDERDFVRLALSELGVHRFNMRNNYGRGISAATDNLLGIKYLISKEDIEAEKGYERLAGIGEYSIFKNPDTLPVCMLVNEEIENVKVDIEDVFDNLNHTWSAMTGIKEKVFIEEDDITFSIHNITDPISISQKDAKSVISLRDAKIVDPNMEKVSDDSTQGSSDSSSKEDDQKIKMEEWGTRQEKPENTNYIMITFTASRDGAVYSYNRSGMTEDNGSIPHALNYEGYFHKGDIVTSYLVVEGTLITNYLLEDVAGRFKIAYLDSNVLSTMSRIILNRPSEITKLKNTHLIGSFTSEEGQKLMFTIPYDEGWTLLVDGEKKNLKKAIDVFMVTDIAPGLHNYELKFIPTGLKTGELISAFSGVLVVMYLFIKRFYHCT